MSDLDAAGPCGTEPRALESLVTGERYIHKWQSGTLMVHVPRLELFDAIKVTF